MDVVLIEGNNPPAGLTVESLSSRDGLKLRIAQARTPEPCRGTIVIMQGRAEFIEKYFEVMRELVARGFDVATMDLRGQGLSGRLLAEPRKGHVNDFEVYKDDLDVLMRKLEAGDGRPPFLILAHSTGGTIALDAMQSWPGRFRSAILCMPFLGLGGPRFLARLIRYAAIRIERRGYGHLWARWREEEGGTGRTFIGNFFTSDRARFRRVKDLMAADPRLVIGAPTFGWLAAAFRAFDKLASRQPNSLDVTALMLIAGSDPVVSRDAIEDFAAQEKWHHLVTIPRARHEIMMERDELREKFWLVADTFLDRILGT